MKIMALDTVATSCTVAVNEDSKLLREEILNLGKTHSETLQASCDSMLEILELSYQDIDLFAVTVGPGSYTGLRIGLTAAKAMAYASQKKLLPLTSLEVQAANYRVNSTTAILSILDARARRVYAGLYANHDVKNSPTDIQNSEHTDPENNLNTISYADYLVQSASLGNIEAYLQKFIEQRAKLKLNINNLLIVGDCAETYAEDTVIIELLEQAEINLLGAKNTRVQASDLATLAHRRYLEEPKLAVLAADVMPIYLNHTEAERNNNYYI